MCDQYAPMLALRSPPRNAPAPMLAAAPAPAPTPLPILGSHGLLGPVPGQVAAGPGWLHGCLARLEGRGAKRTRLVARSCSPNPRAASLGSPLAALGRSLGLSRLVGIPFDDLWQIRLIVLLQAPPRLVRLRSPYEQHFDELLGAVPGIAFRGFLALHCTQFIRGLRRDLRRKFQKLAIVTRFGLRELQAAQLVGMPG
jgi:hypothetical protein